MENNGGCQHNCFDYLVTPKTHCTCNAGYRLRDDLHTCEFIDLCDSRNNGGCSHYCLHEEGQMLECSCPEGYKLTFDQKTCSIINACNLNNGGCQEGLVCTFIEEIEAYECRCPEGHRLIKEQTCEPYGCNKDNGGCEQFCAERGQGEPICGCYNGYQLGSDGKTCERSSSRAGDIPYDPCGREQCEHICQQVQPSRLS